MDNRNGKRMMAAACRYASCRFALNYCMYGDMLSDRNEDSDSLKAFQKSFHQLMGEYLNNRCDIEKIDELRNQIIRETEAASAYLDCFRIYEYVLNRLEGRFKESLPVYEDSQVIDAIMGYIVSAKETAIQNERIKSVLEQLPLRFTKAKFSAIVSQALSIYEGTDQKSLKQVLKMLRSESMLDLPENMQESQPVLWEMLKKLRDADYKNLTEEQFHELLNCLTLAEEKLSVLSSDCMMMMDLVNDFYVICLTRKDTLMDSQEEALIHGIIESVYQSLEQDESVFHPEMEERLVQMEGRQERYYEQWSRYDLSDLDVLNSDEEGRADYQLLRKIDLLLSTSSFMSLEEEVPEPGDDILLSRKAVEEMCAPFLHDLEESWKSMPKCVMRSVMAKLLAVLPMFFTSSDEIREFIGGCLSACTDFPEKTASIQLIHELMESEDAFV